jgi:predicted hotdog family 3-hydroxylacyl-ACP dehydratase
MVLLDEVVDAGDDWIACKVSLRPGSPFVESGSVPGFVAIEYMAQCVAAFAGLEARTCKRPVRVGYIVGIRRVDFPPESFRVGQDLIVSAKRVWGDDVLGNFDCRVEVAGRCASTGALSVYQGEAGLSWIGQETSS